MKKQLTVLILIMLVATLSVGCSKLNKKPVDKAACIAAPVPNSLSSKIPDWSIQPQMLMWETNLSYTLTLKNLSVVDAKDVRIYIGSQPFGWEEMRFDYGKWEPSQKCPELRSSEFNSWVWSKEIPSEERESKYRPLMENTVELRIVWRDSEGWHVLEGALPSQYYNQKYQASEMKPRAKK